MGLLRNDQNVTGRSRQLFSRSAAVRVRAGELIEEAKEVSAHGDELQGSRISGRSLGDTCQHP